MNDEQDKRVKVITEYIVVTDKTSEVLLSTKDRYEAKRAAGVMRRAGGEVTIFRSTKL